MNADQCVHCGLCLTACPTYQVSGLEVESPRGRLVLLKDWADNPDSRDRETAGWLDDCLDCRACESVCPANIPTGHLVEEWRATAHRSKANRRVMFAMTQLVGSRRGLSWLRRISRMRNQSWLPMVARLTLPGLTEPALELAMGVRSPERGVLSRDSISSDVQSPDCMLFVGCVMDAIYPESNQHTTALLRLSGKRVAVPPAQVCCGALHLHGGSPEQARRFAKKNIAAFEASGCDQVVVNAAGCGTTLKEYPNLFDGEPSWQVRAQRFSTAVTDALELLADQNLPELPPTGDTVAVHDACHHAAQNIVAQPRALLKRAGFEIREMAESSRCCGSAGVYNLSHPVMSRALAEKKVNDIPNDVTLVAAANPGCIMQIQAAAPRHRRPEVEVVHPLDLVYAAYAKAGYWENFHDE